VLDLSTLFQIKYRQPDWCIRAPHIIPCSCIVQQQSTSNLATVTMGLDESPSVVELSEFDVEDLDLSDFGEASEYASADIETIDVQLEAATEVSFQLLPPQTN